MSLDASAEAAAAAPDTTTAPDAQAAPAAETQQSLRDIQLETAKRLLADAPADDKATEGEREHHSKAQPRDDATKRWTNTKPDGSPTDKTGAKPEDGQADETAAEAAQDDRPEGKDDQPPAKEPPAEPPAYLSPDLKARWGKMEPDVRDAVAADALQARQAISRLGRALESYRPFEQTAREHQEFFKATQTAPHQVFDNLMQWNTYLERNPAAAIRALADTYRVDLAQFAPAQQQQTDDLGLPPDPQVSALQQEIAQLKGIIGQFDQRMRGVTTQLSAREEAEQNYLAQQREEAISRSEDELAAFEVHNPDFRALLDNGDIAVEIAKLQRVEPNLSRKDTLQKAYDRARWANPDMRTKLIAEQSKAQEAERAKAEAAKRDAAQKAAASAKRAGQANVRGIPNSTTPPPSVRDAQAEVLRKYGMMA